MLKSVLVVLALVTVSATADMMPGMDMCPTDVANKVYSFENLPYDCLHTFEECPMNLCTCAGLEFDATTLGCKGSARRSQSPCDALDICVRDYISCVNTQFANAEDLGLVGNCTAGETSFSFFHDQALQNVVYPDMYNMSDLYTSCQDFKCFVENATSCTGMLSSESVCVAPAGFSAPITPAPGSTPAPTNPDGTYAVPTKIIKIILTFLADFDNLVSTPQGKQQLKDIMTNALTKKLNYKTVVNYFKYVASGGAITESRRKNIALAAGNLQVTGQATVPASDTSTINSVLANVNSLKSDTSTSWYAALSTACGCTVPPPSVTSSVVDGAAPQAVGSTSEKCGSGCIAGIVIGCVVFVVIVVAVTIVIIKKKSANVVAPSAVKEPAGKE